MTRLIVLSILLTACFQTFGKSTLTVSELRRAFPEIPSDKPDEAIPRLRKLLQDFDENGNHAAFYIRYALGRYYGAQKNHPQALAYFTNCLHEADAGKDSLLIGWSAYQLGNVYLSQGNFSSTIHCFVLANTAFRRTDPYNYAHTLYEIGNVYFTFDAYRVALNYFRRSLALKKQRKEWASSIPFACWMMAEAHCALKNQDSALYYYQLSSVIADTTRNIPYYGNEGVAQIYINRGHYTKALEYLQPVKIWYFKARVSRWIADLGLLYMEIYARTGNNAKFRYWAGVTHQHAFSEFLPEQQRRYYELNAFYHSSLNDFKQAYTFQKAANTVRETILDKLSLSNIDVLVEAFAGQELQYRSTLMQLRIEQLHARHRQMEWTNRYLKKRNQFATLISVLSIAVIFLLAIFVSSVIKRKKSAQQLNQKLEKANAAITRTVQHLQYKEERIRAQQQHSPDVYLVIDESLRILQQNPASVQWFRQISGTSQTYNLEHLLDAGKIAQLRHLMATTSPFERVAFSWEWPEDELRALQCDLMNLTEDVSVNGFVVHGVDISGELKEQQELIYLLESEIWKKDQEISKVNQQAAISSLQLDMQRRHLDGLSADIHKPEAPDSSLQKIRSLLRNEALSENHWQQFSMYFDRTNAQFFSKLRQKHPFLTVNEEKHCAFIRMRLSNKEAANLLAVEPETVKKARQRLKKKIGLTSSEQLINYLAGL